MSRKSKRNTPPPPPPPTAAPQPSGRGRAALFIGVLATLAVAFAGAVLLYRTQADKAAEQAAAKNVALLVRTHSPTLGKPEAKVHIVEFLDPACETCRAFYPEVKKIMAANPDRIRLSVRHVPFHQGSEAVVRILEASRAQGKYWETLEAVLARQGEWVLNHRGHVDRVWPLLSGVGLDLDLVRAHMDSREIAQRIERDLSDAASLGVNKTPEFFVNGRPMPRFGLEELQALVSDALRANY